MTDPKFDKPLLPIDLKKLSVISPTRRGSFLPTVGEADWQFSGPAGRDPYDTYGRPRLFYPYKVTSHDDWATVTERAHLSKPSELIRMNFFGVETDHEVINWYLLHYVGCVRTRDGVNCSFSDDAKPGIIWLPLTPHVRWPPVPKIKPWDCTLTPVSQDQLARIDFAKWREANVFGTDMVLRAHTYVSSPQGLRYIWAVNSQEIFFTLVQSKDPLYKSYLGVLFSQPNGVMCGRADVLGGLWRDVADRGGSLRQAAEWEKEVILGLLAGGGRALQLAIATAGSIDFLLSDKVRKYELHFEALLVVIEEMYRLRMKSPVLFDLFIGGLFAEAKKQLGAGNLGSPNGTMAGWVLSKVGPEILANRMNVLKTVADGLEKLAKSLAKSLEKSAKEKAKADFKKDSADFIQGLQKAGIAYTPGKEAEILNEIEKHPEAIGQALARISAAFARVK